MTSGRGPHERRFAVVVVSQGDAEFQKMESGGVTVGREHLRGTDMILTTRGNRRVLCTSVKNMSGSIREAADRAIPARSEICFLNLQALFA